MAEAVLRVDPNRFPNDFYEREFNDSLSRFAEQNLVCLVAPDAEHE